MSGVSINLGGGVGCSSGSGVVPMSTVDNKKNAKPSILALLSDMHRITKAGISFGKLSIMSGVAVTLGGSVGHHNKSVYIPLSTADGLQNHARSKLLPLKQKKILQRPK